MTRKISCVPTSVQRGALQEPQAEASRRLKGWRCDLTALSHTYNLYFVAASDTIHIYKPSFPDQSLPDGPELILRPPISSPHLDYAVDPQCPHSITRLHVDFLGVEEVVLVVCDDGDVIGYSISRIQHALERRGLRDDPEADTDVRVFLHMNMGKSAWGLAVHREARMIAVSANTHDITVVAYALAPEPKTNNETATFCSSYQEQTEESDAEESVGVFDRTQTDHVIKLRGQANIPSVSFDNNGTDPTGRWLYSVDIKGKVLLWDLHNPRRPAQTVQVGRCASAVRHDVAPACISLPNGHCDCSDSYSVPHAAWDAIFIDPRACRETSSPEEAFNKTPIDLPPGFWDITNALQFTGIAQDDTEAISNWELVDSMEMTLDSDTEGEGDEETGAQATDQSAHTLSAQEFSNIQASPTEDGEMVEAATLTSIDISLGQQASMPTLLDNHSNVTTHGSAHGDAVSPGATGFGNLQQLTNVFDPDLEHSGNLQEALGNNEGADAVGQGVVSIDHENDADWESEDENTPMDDAESDDDYVPTHTDQQDETGNELESVSSAGDELSDVDSEHLGQLEGIGFGHAFAPPPRPPAKKTYCEISTAADAPLTQLPRSPTLIITKSEIHLLQSIVPPDPTATGSPIVIMSNPLFPQANSPANLFQNPPTPAHDRLCFSTYIPELAVFVAATPAGRIGIFSLTKCSATIGEKSRMIYGFRQDYLLPTPQQIDAHPWLRHSGNGSRIVGVAVGPVQGQLMEDCDEREGSGFRSGQRWRMLVLYMDWSLVTYVLGDEDEMGVSRFVV